ncbi:MAG TPA: FAD-binding oxidoreductase [Thermoanaerobaculia bacterium]|nr:FAD-binding oxidoreductase [Thermoanaerobaculia bacterium]
MPQVVIVGAGVIGASVACHLALRGWRDVLVLDRAPRAGDGSTSRATGGFRSQFATEINIRLSLLSREKLLRFEEETGVDPGYAQHGYLFLAFSPEALAQLTRLNALHHRTGVPEARLIDPAEVRDLNPAVTDPRIVGGAFCPTDGFIRAMQILRGYCEAATRLGVRFRFDCGEVAFRSVGDRIASARTRDGEIEGDIFVNAAGAWSSSLSAVPVQPLPRHVAATVETDALPASMPMTIWADDGFHLRVRDRRVLLLLPHDAPFSNEARLDEEWLKNVVSVARERVEVVRDVPIDRAHCWSGLYEMSPDGHILLGPAADFRNLFVACGGSGHGVMHSPAIGEILAALITGGPPPFDVHPLRPSRFDEGKPITASEIL